MSIHQYMQGGGPFEMEGRNSIGEQSSWVDPISPKRDTSYSQINTSLALPKNGLQPLSTQPFTSTSISPSSKPVLS